MFQCVNWFDKGGIQGLRRDRNKCDHNNQYSWTTNLTSGGYLLDNVGGRMVTGEFTGDGKLDIATFYRNSSTSATLHVFKSTSTSSNITFELIGLGSTGSWTSTYSLDNVDERMVAGRFNNTDHDDIAVFYENSPGSCQGTIDVFLSNASATQFSKNVWYNTAVSGGYCMYKIGNRVVSANFNKNDPNQNTLDDIATFYNDGSSNAVAHVFISDGSKFNLHNGGSNGWWKTSPDDYFTSIGNYSLNPVRGRMVAPDLDNNGGPDIVTFYQSIGTHPDAWINTYPNGHFNYLGPIRC